MKYKFNPFTGTFDMVGSGGGGGGITGPSSSTNNAIVRWNGSSGSIVKNSKALIQDGGGIQAQAFLYHRFIQDTVVIPTEYSMIATDVVIDGGEIIINADGELVII